MNYSKWPVEIKDFNSGSYTVRYSNLYGRITEKTVLIPATKQYELALCPDELNEHPQNSLAQLQNGEMIKITFSSQGCFHDVKEVLSLTKQKDAFVATLSYDGKLKTRMLDSTKLKAFRRFENELIAIRDRGGCTTTDFYAFVSKTMTFRKVDGGCEWKGFYLLKKVLFGKLD